MKKIFSVLLAVFMIVSNTCVVFANENVELYAYTTDTEGFDAYATEKIGAFLYGHYEQINENLEIGKGILIINNNDYPKVLYPVWNNNEIKGTFIVVNVDGEYSGTYSEMYANQLNELIPLTSEAQPLKLVSDNGFYALVGEVVYSINQLVEKSNNVISIDTTLENLHIINSFEKMPFNQPIVPRYPTSKYLSWTRYTSLQPAYDESDGYCAAYCLYNIFRNKGITTHTFSNVKAGVPNYGITMNYLKSYLTNNGYSYTASSGYLDINGVIGAVYSYNSYVLMLTCRVDYNDELGYFGHAMVLTGYSTVGNTYRVWDPVYSDMKTMDANTRKVTTAEGFTFRWSGGYVYNIQ